MRRAALVAFAICLPLQAVIPERDFSGKWVLAGPAPAGADANLSITMDDSVIRCATDRGAWTFRLDGSDSKYHYGDESRNSAVKWEGAALLVNTLVSGASNYTLSERWKLSPEHDTLTITRQTLRGGRESEASLIYRRPGTASAAPAAFAHRPEAAPADGEYAIPAGTHILLRLVNALDTKHSKEGDRVYLETAVPVASGGHIVIPQRSSVAGTITRAKPPGHVSGKGELFIRFDSLTLANGVTRDFRSRIATGDGSEGKMTGESNKSGDAGKVAIGTGMGAGVGSIAGVAGGHPGMGTGIGAAAGAAAGLATVLTKRGQGVVLPRGSTVDMMLDRELRYRAAELW